MATVQMDTISATPMKTFICIFCACLVILLARRPRRARLSFPSSSSVARTPIAPNGLRVVSSLGWTLVLPPPRLARQIICIRPIPTMPGASGRENLGGPSAGRQLWKPLLHAPRSSTRADQRPLAVFTVTAFEVIWWPFNGGIRTCHSWKRVRRNDEPAMEG